jgi:hypothetical protein
MRKNSLQHLDFFLRDDSFRRSDLKKISINHKFAKVFYFLTSCEVGSVLGECDFLLGFSGFCIKLWKCFVTTTGSFVKIQPVGVLLVNGEFCVDLKGFFVPFKGFRLFNTFVAIR